MARKVSSRSLTQPHLAIMLHAPFCVVFIVYFRRDLITVLTAIHNCSRKAATDHFISCLLYTSSLLYVKRAGQCPPYFCISENPVLDTGMIFYGSSITAAFTVVVDGINTALPLFSPVTCLNAPESKRNTAMPPASMENASRSVTP